MSKLTVTTVRHNLSDLQLAECMAQYKTDENLLKRVDIEGLAKKGFSRRVVVDHGRQIETIVTIDKE